MSGKIKVLVVEPGKPCQVREVEDGLKDLQAIVGGYIEIVTPFTDAAAIVCNEEGKLRGLPYNRPLLDRDGAPYDILCGTFFITGVQGENFVSLTDDQIRVYKDLYDNVMVLTVERPGNQAEIVEEDAMPDFAVGCQVSFRLLREDQGSSARQDAFISHVKGIFNNDEALSERTVGDLYFTFQGLYAEVGYTFAKRDKDAASAELFSKLCVLNVRDQLEGYGCRIEKIECFAEELEDEQDRARGHGAQKKHPEKSKGGPNHER